MAERPEAIMMRSISLVLTVAALAASTAGAATLSIGSDKLTYQVGETVTVTVTGDDGYFDLDNQFPAQTYGIFGRLDYGGALVDNGTRTQTQLVGRNGNWVK